MKERLFNRFIKNATQFSFLFLGMSFVLTSVILHGPANSFFGHFIWVPVNVSLFALTAFLFWKRDQLLMSTLELVKKDLAHNLGSAQDAAIIQNSLSKIQSVNNYSGKEVSFVKVLSALNQTSIVVTTDLKGSIIAVNEAFEKISGYSKEELIGQNHRLLKSNFHPPSFYKELWNTISAGEIWKGEICNKKKNGEYYWVATHIVPILDKEGRPKEYLAIRNDITQRKWQESIFKCMHELQRFALANPTDLQKNSRFILSKLTELTSSEFGFVGKILKDSKTFDPFLKAYALSDISWSKETAELYQEHEKTGFEFRNLNTLFGHTISTGERIITNTPAEHSKSGSLPAGHPPLNSYIGIPIHVEGQLYGMIGMANRPGGYNVELVDSMNPIFEFLGQLYANIEAHVEEARLNQTLRKEKKNLEALLNSINEVVFFINDEFKCIKAWRSPKYYDIFPAKNYEDLDLIGTLGEKYAPIIEPFLKRCKETSLPQFKEICINHEEQIWFNFKVKKIILNKEFVYMINVYEISVEKKIRDQLDFQKQKAESSARLAGLGELAAGIAHEINNPLTIIAGYTENLLGQIKKEKLEPKSLLTGLERIRGAAQRATSIVKGMQKLSRQSQADEAVAVGLKDLIEESIAMAQPRLKSYEIDLKFEIGEGAQLVQCRPGEILQVLINLIHNAADAISQRPEKWIKIFAERREDSIHIHCTDCGEGIAPEVVEKLMQPFFTTKAPGKGTGLGLSISDSIAKSNGGELYYDSKSKNTSFVLKLPAAIAKAEPAQAA